MLRRTLVLLVSFLPLADCAGEDWTQFRGPRGDGTSQATGLPITFAEGSPEIVWKTPVPGRAWSSPVIEGGHIWLTNAPEIQNPPGSSNQQANAGDTTTPLETPIRLSAVCVDFDSGEVLKDITIFEVARPQFTHLTNSYASPTPAIEAGRLYAHFGTYGTACIDTETGDKLWERRDLNCHHWRGPGSSPVVHEDLLFLCFDGYDKQFIVALDKNTGETIWERKREVDYKTDNGDRKKAYCTPQVIRVGNRNLLISPFAMATIAYDPHNGDAVWTVYHGGMNAAARPLFGNGLVYINAGDGRDALVAVRPDGRGDVTETHIKWRLGQLTPKRPSQLLIGEHYYMVDDGGVAACLNALTGEVLWKGRVGGTFWSSPLYADGHIYACSQKGRVSVIRASPTSFEVVATNRFDEGFNASPAVAGRSLVLRSFSHLYRIEKPGAP